MKVYDTNGKLIQDVEISIREPKQEWEEAPEKDCISEDEKRYLRKLSILRGKLKAAGVKAVWDGGAFLIQKAAESGYPLKKYVWWDGEYGYCFGGYESEFESTRVSDTVNRAKRWLTSKLVKK